MRTKIALIFVFCITLISCDPNMFDFDDCIWRIKNNTDQTIVFNIFIDQKKYSQPILAGDSTTIQTVLFPIKDGIPFYYALERKDSITITVDDLVKRTWRKHDDKSGRHFYNQSSWFFYKTPRMEQFENYNFTFIIEESDLD